MDDFLQEHLYIIILCGGSGKRLWPRSRNKTPKQFIRLFGKRTIFQETVERSKRFVPPSRIFVVTNVDYVDEIRSQAPSIPQKNIIAEPRGMNTALAVGVGATHVHKVDPLAVIVNFASDHHIAEMFKFDKAVETAASAANLGDYLVTIGVKPTFPHTGMGYIKTSRFFKRINDSAVYKVEKFVEKPDSKTAEKFLSEGDYYWNANLYTWRADSILRAIEAYMPKMFAQLELIRASLGTAKESSTMEKVYEEAEEISIDVGVSEKVRNMLLIPSTFSWSDIGDWKVAYDVSRKDKNKNVIICENEGGEFLGLDTQNCLVHFSDQLVATIGVRDLIIVDTKDALLVVHKDRAQDVKKLVNLLVEKKKLEYI